MHLWWLKPWWEKHERRWVTFDSPDAISLLKGERVDFAHHPTNRNLKNALRNLVLSEALFREDPPDLVVTSGAGVGVPFVVSAWRRGIRSIYLEVYDRILTPSLSARLCAPLVDVVALQWSQQLMHHPYGTMMGTIR